MDEFKMKKLKENGVGAEELKKYDSYRAVGQMFYFTNTNKEETDAIMDAYEKARDAYVNAMSEVVEMFNATAYGELDKMRNDIEGKIIEFDRYVDFELA